MGKGLKIFLLAVGGLFAFSLIRKAQAGKNLQVIFRTLRVLKPTGIALPTIQAIFTIQNPSSQQITINSLVGELLLNGKLLSNLSNFEKIIVPGNNQVDLPINIRIGLIDVISNVISLLKQKGKVTAQFEGNVNAENFIIPVTQTISI